MPTINALTLCSVLTSIALSTNVSAHNLSFDNDPAATHISVSAKNITANGRSNTDQTFVDGLGREIYMRGWNVSGSGKLAETGYKPFKSAADAGISFDLMGETAGSNVVRFTVAWEGVNPRPNEIDEGYLQAIVAQMREAIRNRMYVLVDFHNGNYSRYLFGPNSKFTGDGAPQYAVRHEYRGKSRCVPCVSWFEHSLLDPNLGNAIDDFWNNRAINGNPVRIQDAFLWQMGVTLDYIRTHLSPAEFNYVLGLDPFNEPVAPNHLTKQQDFNQKLLWPFHLRVREVMDVHGWAGKLAFSELIVYWSTPIGAGGFVPDVKPGARFVFDAHFYDVPRLANLAVLAPGNGIYLKDIAKVRDVARAWGSAPFLSEFGAAVPFKGASDPNPVINYIYQALEANNTGGLIKSRYISPYTHPVSATEWHWDTNYGRHQEFQNGVGPMLTAADAWNNEDFSVVNMIDGSPGWNINPDLVQRTYPRRSQGRIVNFYENNLVADKSGRLSGGASIRPQGSNREYLRGNRFSLLVWQGRSSNAPSEIFVPRTLNSHELVVITERQVRSLTQTDSAPVGVMNEVALLADIGRSNPANSGKRLLVWDDADSTESADSWHYALIFHRNPWELWNSTRLQQLQADLTRVIVQQKKSPVWMTGNMEGGLYEPDIPR